MLFRKSKFLLCSKNSWGQSLSEVATSILKEAVPVLEGEIIDATLMSKKALLAFLEAQIAAAAEGATHLITDSACVREEVIDYFGVDESRVTSVPLAADEQFRYRTEIECREILTSLRLGYKRFYLFASTIEPRKNLLRICAAYKSLRAAVKTDWPIIFVGGPGWRSEVEHSEAQKRSKANAGRRMYLHTIPSAFRIFMECPEPRGNPL